MDILKDMWRYANACYHEPRQPDFLYSGECHKYHTFEDDTDFCLVSEEKKRIVVAIRGSDSKGGNFRAWISNLQGLDRINDTIDPGIHDGFGALGRKWIKTILDIVAGNTRDIYLTGHSRGAAGVGCLALFLIRSKELSPGRKVSVLGFGTPNYCSKEVRNEINFTKINYTNINTTHDIVSKIPPHPIMYRPGKEYELQTNWFLPFPPIPPLAVARGIRDHLPETYIKLIKKRC